MFRLILALIALICLTADASACGRRAPVRSLLASVGHRAGFAERAGFRTRTVTRARTAATGCASGVCAMPAPAAVVPAPKKK